MWMGQPIYCDNWAFVYTFKESGILLVQDFISESISEESHVGA